jgi:hypothetical protein
MPVDFEALVAIPVVFGSIVVVTVSIIRYKLKKKELRCVTISITHEHSWPRCRNASTSQSGCSPPDVHRRTKRVSDRMTR